jgi:membrane protein
VLALQGTASLISIIGLLWSGSGVFYTLAYNISSAWQPHKARGFFAGRFIALIIVGILAGLLFLSVVSTAVVDLLAQANISLVGLNYTYTISPAQMLSRILPAAIRLLVFLGLYRWVPNTKVAWVEALWGAFVAALGWELTTIAFTWYLGSRWGRFELIYGSLGTIIGLMLWIYIGTLITLFGAHLSAAVAHHRQTKAKVAAKQQESVYEAQAQ